MTNRLRSISESEDARSIRFFFPSLSSLLLLHLLPSSLTASIIPRRRRRRRRRHRHRRLWQSFE